MKTSDHLRAEIDQLEKKRRASNISRQVKGKARAKINFIKECISLLESGMTHESAVSQLTKAQENYNRAKATYYEHCGTDKEGNKVKNRLYKFHAAGGRKLWRQIQNFKFLLAA
jgi:hypothetical protein